VQQRSPGARQDLGGDVDLDPDPEPEPEPQPDSLAEEDLGGRVGIPPLSR
jgi:hypothetical protein